MNNDSSSHSNMDSQTLLNQLIIDYLKEKKRKERWRWVVRVIILLILAYLVFQLFFSEKAKKADKSKIHVGLVDINGEIADGKEANADNFSRSITSAYKNKELKAFIIRINSPGGSPVQAEYIYNTIQYYKKLRPEVKIYSVCVDACASAAYYIASATEEIYASPSSMVGSIGVIYNGFGFVDAMNKIGVTRRLQTAGSNKGFLDPFSPIVEQQKQALQTMLDLVHQQFIQRVKEGRGSRLHATQDTFSGLFWTGEQALTMGLIDGFASSRQVARDKVGVDTLVDYTHKQNLLDRVSKNLGASMANELSLHFGLKSGIR